MVELVWFATSPDEFGQFGTFHFFRQTQSLKMRLVFKLAPFYTEGLICNGRAFKRFPIFMTVLSGKYNFQDWFLVGWQQKITGEGLLGHPVHPVSMRYRIDLQSDRSIQTLLTVFTFFSSRWTPNTKLTDTQTLKTFLIHWFGWYSRFFEVIARPSTIPIFPVHPCSAAMVTITVWCTILYCMYILHRSVTCSTILYTTVLYHTECFGLYCS